MKYLAIILLFVSSCVFAEDPAGMWYDPEHPGHGLQISGDNGFGRSLVWYLHRADGSTGFVISGENCESFPCVVALYEPTSGFLGGKFGGPELELGEPVGMLELTPVEGGFEGEYDLIGFASDNCSGISPGGLIFRGCVGKVSFSRLTY